MQTVQILSESNGQKSLSFGSSLWIWVAAFTLVIIISYPASPIMYLLMLEPPELMYSSMIIMLAISAVLLKKNDKNSAVNEIAWIGWWAIILFLVSYIKNFNSVAIRDALTIAVVCLFVARIRSDIYIKVLHRYIFINAILLFVSLCILLGWYVNIYDLNEWHVSKLNYVNSSNPVLLREGWGDFSYHLPFYVVNIPFDPDGVAILGYNYLRQPLLYAEPAYTWLYTSGILMFGLGDRSMPHKFFVYPVLGISLLVSLSAQGFLTAIAALVIATVFYRSTFLKLNFRPMILFAIFFIYALMFFNVHEIVLNKFLPNTYEQYLFYKENISLVHRLQSASLFGVGFSDEVEYGSSVLILRYGIVGFLSVCLIWAWLIFRSLELMSYKRVPFRYLLLPASVISSVVTMFRIPQYNQLLPIVLFLGGYYIFRRPGIKQ